MAKKATATAEDVRAQIANRPRQSVTRYVELFNIVNTLAPERLEEFFSTDEIDLISAVADAQRNPVEEFRQKSDEKQLEIAINALTNTDKQNGYAHYTFNQEAYDEKTRPKTPRTRKTAVDKIDELLSSVTDEERDALTELLKARGIEA